MKQEIKLVAIPDEIIMEKIYLIRSKKVMLDKDLAKLYNVDTKQLKRAVKRNIIRFPEDFMFTLNTKEFNNLRNQIVTSSWGGTRYLPMAFTEYGVLMLASVLNSERAIQINIQIVRIFNKMRELLQTHKDILHKLEEIEKKYIDHDQKIMLIFEYLRQLEQTKHQELEQGKRKVIKGYRKEKS